MDASFGERKIHQILENAGLNYKMEYIFPDLRSPNGRPLRFDFVVFDDDGNTFEAHFELGEPPQDTMVIATPFEDDKLAFYYNQKI